MWWCHRGSVDCRWDGFRSKKDHPQYIFYLPVHRSNRAVQLNIDTVEEKIRLRTIVMSVTKQVRCYNSCSPWRYDVCDFLSSNGWSPQMPTVLRSTQFLVQILHFVWNFFQKVSFKCFILNHLLSLYYALILLTINTWHRKMGEVTDVVRRLQLRVFLSG